MFRGSDYSRKKVYIFLCEVHFPHPSSEKVPRFHLLSDHCFRKYSRIRQGEEQARSCSSRRFLGRGWQTQTLCVVHLLFYFKTVTILCTSHKEPEPASCQSRYDFEIGEQRSKALREAFSMPAGRARLAPTAHLLLALANTLILSKTVVGQQMETRNFSGRGVGKMYFTEENVHFFL